MDLGAQKTGQLAADGQAETGAAVGAARAAVGLLECLEDDLLLLRGNTDPGVGDGERDGRTTAGQHAVLQAGGSAIAMVRSTRPWWVNLKAFDRRFLRICCRRFASVWIARGRSGSR